MCAENKPKLFRCTVTYDIMITATDKSEIEESYIHECVVKEIKQIGSSSGKVQIRQVKTTKAIPETWRTCIPYGGNDFYEDYACEWFVE